MVKSTNPSFPWDQIKAESMRNLCRDLGLKQPYSTRSTMIDFLESVWKVGLPKALDNASTTTTHPTPRTSQKRTRDTSTTTPTTTTPSSTLDGDESPSKRYRRGPDVMSNYNTRFKSDRRGRVSDPGPIKRPRGRPRKNGADVLSAVVDRPVRTGQKRKLSPLAGTSTRSGRRVTLGEPLASDATPGDEESGEETSILATVTKRRRTLAPTPPIIRTRKQKEDEESAATPRRTTSTPKRVVLNGVTRVDDEYQLEQGEEDGRYSVSGSDSEEGSVEPIKTRQLPKRRSLPARLPRRHQPRRLRPSPAKSRAVRKPRRATRPRPTRTVAKSGRGRGRPRRRPPTNNIKFVFDGVDVPPINVAWRKKKRTDEEYEDEDADGEVDEEVHPASSAEAVDVPKEKETEKPEESEETGEPTEAVEPVEEQEQEGGEIEAVELGEQGEAQEQEEVGEEPEIQEVGQVQPEEAEEQVDLGSVAEEQTEQVPVEEDEEIMDQGEDEVVDIGIGLIPDDTSSLGNSNKENEAPEEQMEEETTEDTAAEIAAQTALFGEPITVTATTRIMSGRVEYIADDEIEGDEGLGGIQGMENMDDDMQGPTVDDLDSFMA